MLKKTMGKEIKQVLILAEVFIVTSLIMVVGANLAFVLHTPMKEPLTDVGFLLLPEIKGTFSNLSDLLTAICPILYALHTAGMTRKERCQVFVSFFRIMSICYGLRTFTVPLTSLPGPATHCRLDAVDYHPPTDWIDVVTRIGPMHGQFNTCGDLLFSGHMCYNNVALLLYLRNLDRRWPNSTWLQLRWIVASLYLLGVTLLCISARKHYTVDVVLGKTTAVFQMNEILFALRRDHIIGLNCGMWDYTASFIARFSTKSSEFIVPDRKKYINMLTVRKK
jgi:hypothetical protein